MEIFGVVKEISLAGYILRTFIVFIIMIACGRFIPKRATAQLTTYDFVFTWILGALSVAPLLDGKIAFSYTIIPIITLFFWHRLISFAIKHSRTALKIFNGKPIMLINKGQIIRQNLKKHFINVDLLLAELRVKGIFDIADVDYAILEPNGNISILKKKDREHITTKDLNLVAPMTSMTEVLINDGKLLKDKLINKGISEIWLRDSLLSFGITDYKEVYFAGIDLNNNRLYVSLKNVKSM